ncbi:MAG: hypothetical protein JST50_18950 [Bacteroidetes bacterium]|jgi:hypothetical protein|nr:hypothetical protein [Bacteroidota bacterium]
MKKIIYLLSTVSIAYLSSCQKDVSVAPESKTQTSTTAVTPTGGSLAPGNTANTDTVVNITGFIKLELKKDTVNKDNIVIYFTPKSSSNYVPGEDAPFFQGFGAESITSISSDGIPLSVNELPLKQLGDCVKLGVYGKTDGVYKLSLLQKDSIPARYHVWLMDQLKKDSLDLSIHCTYNFDIVTADTTTFGKNRFAVKIRPQ